jgi:hypothetical protein
MHYLLQHRRLHALIVSMAIMLNLFAPAISQAMASPEREALLLEMCSATSPAATASLDGDRKTPPASSTHAMKHCVFCATHADTYAPPPTLPGLIAVLRGHDGYPAPHYQSPALLLTWSSDQPRGPPARA